MKRPLQTQPVYYTIFSPCPTRVFRTFGEENLSRVPFSGHKNTEPRLRFGMWYTIGTRTLDTLIKSQVLYQLS